MPDVTYADPTTTRTPLNFDVLPPIQQASPIVNPPAVRQPFSAQQVSTGQLARPIDYHAQPQNIPSVQQQIKLDSATWKTIDITPNSSARPRVSTTQSVLAGTNVVSGNNFAQEQAFEQAAYLLGWSLSGFWDGAIEGKNYPNEQLRLKRDFAEDGAYAIGNKVGDQVRNIGQQGKANLEDLWKNRPQFEIPTIQIPKFDRPRIPDLSIPKVPEFDIPQLPKIKFPGLPEPTVPEPKSKPQPTTKEKDIPIPREPKIKPIPKNPIDRLKATDLSHCGNVDFWFGTGFIAFQDGTTVRTSVDTVVQNIRSWFPYLDESAFNLIQGIGTDGNVQRYLKDNTFYITTLTRRAISAGKYGVAATNLDFPKMYVAEIGVSIPATRASNSVINTAIDLGSIDGIAGELLHYQTTVQSDSCLLPEPTPTTSTPPPLPPQDCECMGCCPEIDYRKIKALIDDAVSQLDVTAAMPLSFQIRHEGDTPQMIIQFAERKSAANGNKPAKYDSAKYPITVPHWKGGQNDKPALPPYKKGNWEGILVLADNTKVTINAQNESECIKILNAIKPWIDSKMLEGSYFKGGKITTKEPIKETQVYPKYGRYFGKGQKNGKPDWRVDFP
ncbi:MAG: hypothetical protein RM049_13600 [Nostoc sp. DedQUE04]|uniref:hypothetical protein n=1 Tax=Nostoc sp. DedQUE04 TaxID=3075390 RepID=UPI002AD4AEC4|nr:hypothetical protein [Nostoc sp. DedQUE04]MDZ8136322.1 hypothetical protein [Nostoc sp. DedQUE04]